MLQPTFSQHWHPRTQGDAVHDGSVLNVGVLVHVHRSGWEGNVLLRGGAFKGILNMDHF